MSVFPRISLKPEVTDFLQGVFLNKEVWLCTVCVFWKQILSSGNHKFPFWKWSVVLTFSAKERKQVDKGTSSHVFVLFQVLAAVGPREAESRFQKLLTCLSHPPSYTCVRASTHLAPLDEIRHTLAEELKKVIFFVGWGWVGRFCCHVLVSSLSVSMLLLKQQMYSSSAEEACAQLLTHPRIPDVLLLPVDGPRYVRNARPDKSESALWSYVLERLSSFLECWQIKHFIY